MQFLSCKKHISQQCKKLFHGTDNYSHLIRCMTKPTKWPVSPAKSLIRLGICPVWSESSLCTLWIVRDQMTSSRGQRKTDLSLCWVQHHFVGFVILRPILYISDPWVYVLHTIYAVISRHRGPGGVFDRNLSEELVPTWCLQLIMT